MLKRIVIFFAALIGIIAACIAVLFYAFTLPKSFPVIPDEFDRVVVVSVGDKSRKRHVLNPSDTRDLRKLINRSLVEKSWYTSIPSANSCGFVILFFNANRRHPGSLSFNPNESTSIFLGKAHPTPLT